MPNKKPKIEIHEHPHVVQVYFPGQELPVANVTSPSIQSADFELSDVANALAGGLAGRFSVKRRMFGFMGQEVARGR